MAPASKVPRQRLPGDIAMVTSDSEAALSGAMTRLLFEPGLPFTMSGTNFLCFVIRIMLIDNRAVVRFDTI